MLPPLNTDVSAKHLDESVCFCFLCVCFFPLFHSVHMRMLENWVDSLPDRVLMHTLTHTHMLFSDIRQTGCTPF